MLLGIVEFKHNNSVHNVDSGNLLLDLLTGFYNYEI